MYVVTISTKKYGRTPVIFLLNSPTGCPVNRGADKRDMSVYSNSTALARGATHGFVLGHTQHGLESHALHLDRHRLVGKRHYFHRQSFLPLHRTTQGNWSLLVVASE